MDRSLQGSKASVQKMSTMKALRFIPDKMERSGRMDSRTMVQRQAMMVMSSKKKADMSAGGRWRRWRSGCGLKALK